MSKNSKNYSSSIIVPTIWKRVPNRIKGLLKRRDAFDTTLPLSPAHDTTKLKSSLIHCIFPSSRHLSSKRSTSAIDTTTAIETTTTTKKKKQKSTQLKKKNQQWSHSNNSSGDFHDIELYNSEVPLRANLMSFFTSTSLKEQQIGWSNFLSTPTDKLDFMSRTYIGTLGKLRSISHYTMEQQISIHHVLARIQYNSVTQKEKKNKRSQTNTTFAGQSNNGSFSSLLTTTPTRSSITDTILLNNRKPKKTRYIFMLLSTPVSQVTNKVHPVTEAISKLRKPYAETFKSVISSSEEKVVQGQLLSPTKVEKSTNKKMTRAKSIVATFKFVPAYYLLDPATLRGSTSVIEEEKQQQQQEQNRLGTKLGGGTTTINQNKQSSSQQQQQQNNKKDLFINTSSLQQENNSITATTPIIAKIQVQTN